MKFFPFLKGILTVLFLAVFFSLNLSGTEKAVSRYLIKGRPYVKLAELSRFLKIESGYDINTGRVKLYNRGNRSVVAPGYHFIIINGSLVRSRHPVVKKDGCLYLPEKTALMLVSTMSPGKKLVRKKNQYTAAVVKKRPAAPVERRTRKKKFPVSFIIIDAGHGGKDPGAIGKGGLKEKDITLKISRLVRDNLKRSLKGVSIIMTRYSDKFIELSRRTETGNRRLRKNNNGIFLSIHINASISSRISGYETYFLSRNPSNEAARSTAALENNVIVYEAGKSKKKYGDIEYIVAHMMTAQIQRESSMLAGAVQQGMARKNRKFKNRGVRKADFFVLRGALMPAVLVEVGFITNTRESRYLKRGSHQQEIAAGISAGILNFLKKYNSTIR